MSAEARIITALKGFSTHRFSANPSHVGGRWRFRRMPCWHCCWRMPGSSLDQETGQRPATFEHGPLQHAHTQTHKHMCMYMRLYAYTIQIHVHVHTHTHTPTRVHTHTYIHTYLLKCLHAYITTHSHTHISTYLPACLPTCLPTYTHIMYKRAHLHTNVCSRFFYMFGKADS